MNEPNFTEKPEALSVKDLKNIPGYNHINDDEGEAIVDSIKQLCYIVYHLLHSG